MSSSLSPPTVPRRSGPLVVGTLAAAVLGVPLIALVQARPVEALPEPPSPPSAPQKPPKPARALNFAPAPSAAPPDEPEPVDTQPDDTAPAPARPQELTALDENEAAQVLARAWRDAVGQAPSARTLAILWAHWAHETGRGRRMVGHNFGGLKGTGPHGASVLAWTREGPELERVVLRKFRAYSDFPEGASDYIALLRNRYPRAFRAAKQGDVVQFADALAAAGYFTDEPSAYRRALARLALECLERTIPDAALLALDER